MGRVAKILSFVRALRNGANITNVKTDTGGGVNKTAEHFANPGDDSFPLTTDYALNVDVAGSGNEAAVAYLDPINEPKATAGDKRIYARDADSGVVVVEVWLKSDSSAIISNSKGAYEVQADGTTVVSNDAGDNKFNPDGSVDFANGASITAAGDYITAAGISLDTHLHIGNLGSPTGAPIP